MIPTDIEAKVAILFTQERMSVRQVAQQCGIHRDTVRRILVKRGFQEEVLSGIRTSIITQHIPYIRNELELNPKISAARLYDLCQERGYKGGPDHFRAMVRSIRPRRIPEAFLKISTSPGAEAQVDWGSFGKIRVGKALRRLSAFVMVLSWSRKVHLEFFYDQKLHSFIEGHNNAFRRFGGIPQVILYDNLKSVVLEREGKSFVFNPEFTDYAMQLGFERRAVGVRRGNEKGRVERLIRYVRENFFMALNFADLDDLNRKAELWLETKSDARRKPDDSSLTVKQAHAIELESLRRIPSELPPPEMTITARVRKTPYITVDGNEYSVPPQLVLQNVSVRLSRNKLEVHYNGAKMAEHKRSYGKEEVIENPEHIAELQKYKAMSAPQSVRGELLASMSHLKDYLEMISQENRSIGSAISALSRLEQSYGTTKVNDALKEALESGSTQIGAISLILDRERALHAEEVPLPISLSDNPRLHVRVRSLSTEAYDNLGE